MTKKIVEWTDDQRAESARQYERIGYKPGELWPAPPEDLTPDQILELMRRIPDGAGRAGWHAVLYTSHSTKAKTAAFLWLLAGIALLVAGFISEPRLAIGPVLAIVLGALFIMLSVRVFRRSRPTARVDAGSI